MGRRRSQTAATVFGMNKINIGLLGLGIVGTSAVKNLCPSADLLAERVGVDLTVKHAFTRRPNRRNIPVARSLLASDFRKVTRDPDVHVVVEVMGGLDT